MKRKLFVLFSMFAIVAIAFTSCQKDQLIDQTNEIVTMSTPSVPLSGSEVEPVIIGDGNQDCEDVTLHIQETIDEEFMGFEYSSGKLDEGSQYAGTAGPITWSTDPTGTYLTWTSTVPVKAAFILKGGNAANIYLYYPECSVGDSGLASPANASGSSAELSNFQVCWTPCEEEECFEYHEETAWAGIAGGGPSWWFYIEIDEEGGEYPIYAGQEIVEGAYVNIDADGLLTITLGDNLVLQDVEEAVKIQGYGQDELPARRPNAGRFTTYKGDFPANGVDVSDYAYVAVHLDALVKVLVDCLEEPIE